LVDTEHLYFQATQQILASIGVALDQETYHHLFLVQSSGTWHLAEQQGLPASGIEGLKSERNALYRQLLHDHAAPMHGAADVLQSLAPHFVMGVVTGSHRDHFEIIHRTTGFTQYFDFVLTREDYQFSKPDPEPYLKALHVVGYPPEDCVVIEDSERGLTAAKAAGLTCWVIPTPLSQCGDFSAADRVLSNIGETLRYLTSDGAYSEPDARLADADSASPGFGSSLYRS
jgi:HAD superfamily hydrolase (TIGR01509 family)